MDKLQIINRKIFTLTTIQRQILSWRLTNSRIVFTNGCFDILHQGHIELLLKAANFGEVLIVGLNSDESVRKLKGPGRPVQSQFSRALSLAAMEFVDGVILFEEEDPANLIQGIMPDVLVKGNDYTISQIAGAETVLASGGRVELIPLVPGFSTTSLIARLKAQA